MLDNRPHCISASVDPSREIASSLVRAAIGFLLSSMLLIMMMTGIAAL